jgi:hypothetical protein
MDSLEFLLMSPFLQNDGNICSIIFLLFTIIIVSEVIQKIITVSGGNYLHYDYAIQIELQNSELPQFT